MSSPDMATLLPRAEGAILAAAVGDALGWPQEDRRRRSRSTVEFEPKFEFSPWWRREGGQFAAHELEIRAGEYSDDTQLILALARAFRADEQWWERWTSVELPFWLLYERGGGAATKHAARSWSRGKPPWSEGDSTRYFDAGGNGVAMRVLPHCMRGASGDDFSPVAIAVVRDGIATHGHPVAHVGALAYAFALWRAFRSNRTLGYGDLIAETRASFSTWSRLPDELPEEWRRAADRHFRGEYSRIWSATVDQMVEFLQLSQTAIDQGSLSIDRETLESLGAFERQTQGAGTVTAAGALFLASRYASRPSRGIVAGAFCHGADTDTLASMTGGLLGAVNGSDWLAGVAAKVQDRDHLRSTASALLVPNDAKAEEDASLRAVRRFSRGLGERRVGDAVALPDGRRGVIERLYHLPTKTRNEIKSYVLRTDDGQTLHITKRRRKTDKVSARDSWAPKRSIDGKTPFRKEPQVAFAIEVGNLQKSLHFYRDLIGLAVVRQTAERVILSGGVVLEVIKVDSDLPARQLSLPIKPSGGAQTRIIILVALAEFKALHKRMQRAAPWVSRMTTAGALQRFSCIDLDDTLIEIREANGKQ